MPFVTFSRDERTRPAEGGKSRLGFEVLEDRLAPAATPVLVSVANPNPNPDQFAAFGANGPVDVISATEFGDVLLVQSTATNLVPNQLTPPGQLNLFRFQVDPNNPRGGAFELISKSTDPRFASVSKGVGVERSSLRATDPFGNPLLGVNRQPAIALNAVMNEDGSAIAFISTANANDLDPSIAVAADGGGPDLFVWSRSTGTVTLASRTDTDQAVGSVSNPFISQDGKTVSFVSDTRAEVVLGPSNVRQVVAPANSSVAGLVVLYDLIRDTPSTPDLFRAVVGQTPQPLSYQINPTPQRIFLGFDAKTFQQIFVDVNFYVMHGDLKVDPLNRYSTIGAASFYAVRTNQNKSPDASTQYSDLWQYQFDATQPLGQASSAKLFVNELGDNSQSGPGKDATGTFDNIVIARRSGTAVFTYRDLVDGPPGDLVRGPNGESFVSVSRDFELFRATTATGGVGAELITASAAAPNVGANGKLFRLEIAPGQFADRPDPRGYNLTPDGAYLAFTSTATDLNLALPLVDVNGNLPDVFQRNFQTSENQAISVTDASRPTLRQLATTSPDQIPPLRTGSLGSRFPTQTADGLVVAFESDTPADEMTGSPTAGFAVQDTNGKADLFINDVIKLDTLVVSIGGTGNTTGNGGSFAPAMITRVLPIPDPAARFFRNFAVFFSSAATDLDSEATVDPFAIAFPSDRTTLPQLYYQLFPIFITSLSQTFAYSGGDNGFVATAKLDRNGQIVTTNKFQPFRGWTGELRVASADFNGDEVVDVVVGAGPGGGPRVAIIDGFNGRVINDFFAFEPTFRGGVYVGTIDRDGDGVSEILVGAAEGGGPRFQIYDQTGTFVQMDKFAYEVSARTGVRVASGDVNGDGTQDVVVAAGVGGGPRVQVFDGRFLPNLVQLANFFAFEESQRGGAYVSAGNFDGDRFDGNGDGEENEGTDDIVVGGGPEGGPRVRVFNGANITGINPTKAHTFADFFAFDENRRDGVRVLLRDINGDRIADIVAGTGGGFPQIRTYRGGNAGGSDAPVFLTEFVPFDTLIGFSGAWVG